MGAFGGWDMPISYAGAGVVAEHTAVRTAVGIFDVSHLGKALVTRARCGRFRERLPDRRPRPARARAGAVHDVLQRRRRRHRRSDRLPGVRGRGLPDPERGEHRAVVAALAAAAPAGIEVVDRHTRLRGARRPGAGVRRGAARRSACRTSSTTCPGSTATFEGRPVRVCRTGYTGERGYELVPAWDDRPRGVGRAGARGRPARRPAGGSRRPGHPAHRDGLRVARSGPRTEISPVQARVGWAVGWRKPSFFGRDALLAEKAARTAPRSRGVCWRWTAACCAAT